MIDVNGKVITAKQCERGLRVSTLAGSIGMVFFVATGGAYLTGFARMLGATQFEIGVINAFLPLAALAQILSSYMLERKGWRRKPVLCIAASIMRLLWIPILAMPFLLHYTADGATSLPTQRMAVSITLVLMALSQLLSAFGGLAWQAWMGDLIPPDRRGRFYGTRQMIVNAVYVVTGILIGRYLDINNTFEGFAVVFGFGTLFGVADLMIHAFVPEPMPAKPAEMRSFTGMFSEPFKDRSFSGLIFFTIAWNFAMWVMLPFLPVFQIEDLGMSYLSITNMANIYLVSLMIASVAAGKIADKFGGRIVFALSCAGMSFLPYFWIFSDENNWVIMLTSMNILSGIFNAGNQVAINKLLLENSPSEKRSVYIAVFSSIGGLFGGLGPIFGGWIGDLLANTRLIIGSLVLTDLKILFLISAVLRHLSLPLLLKTVEGRPLEERSR